MALDKCPTCREPAKGRNFLYKCVKCGDIVCSSCIKRGMIKTTCPLCGEQINQNKRLKI